MFIESEEMDSVISEYKIREITDCDGTITRGCVLAAVKRVRRMLSGRYDVDRIFSATGEDRDAELLEICKNIALWFLVRRYNVDILYTRVRETYDRDMAYLRELMSGEIPSDLPIRETDGRPAGVFRQGSNPKFNHSW